MIVEVACQHRLTDAVPVGRLQKRMSVTQQDRADRQPIPAGVTKWETYRNGKAVYGGVNDPRMGTLDRREPCRTCGCTFNETGQRGRVNECPGHFGHIEVRFRFELGDEHIAVGVLPGRWVVACRERAAQWRGGCTEEEGPGVTGWDPGP